MEGAQGGHVPPQKWYNIVFYNTSTCSVWFKMHMHNSDDTCAPLSFSPTDAYAVSYSFIEFLALKCSWHPTSSVARGVCDSFIFLPSPVWAEGTVLSLSVCLSVCYHKIAV